MDNHRTWAGIVILLCSALASAASVGGATATVATIDPATASATIQVTNLSNQGIDAFVIISTATFLTGKKEFDEHSKDYGPFYEEYGLLEAGHSVAVKIPFSARPNDPLQRVESQVVVVIYADQTAEVADERAFQNKLNDRKGMANAFQESVRFYRLR